MLALLVSGNRYEFRKPLSLLAFVSSPTFAPFVVKICLSTLAVKTFVSGYNNGMADVTTTGVFIGTGKPEPVRIEISMTNNEEVVDVPTVTLSVSPVDLTHDANRRVETFLSSADASALAQMLLDFAAATEQAIATGEDVDDDYAN